MECELERTARLQASYWRDILDSVNHPAHYTSGEIECIDAERAALGEEGFRAFCRGNALKYIWRAGKKGDAAEDLKKAVFYLRMAVGDDPRRGLPKAFGEGLPESFNLPPA